MKIYFARFEFFFDNDKNKVISTKDRCLMTYEILSRTTFSKKLLQPTIFYGGEKDPNIGVDLLVANQTFIAAYSLHEVIIYSLKYCVIFLFQVLY